MNCINPANLDDFWNKVEKFVSNLNRDHIILACVLMAGTVLRLMTLDAVLFGDEQHTVRVILYNPFQYIVTYHWGSYFHMILVHLLLPHGPLEIMARLPALIFGILTIWAMYQTTRLLFGKREALFTASYLAISPYHIYWSQMARGYTTCLFLLLLSLLFFIKAIRKNRIHFWMGYIIFSVLMVYSHLTSLSCIPVHLSFFGVLIAGNFILKNKKLWTLDKSKVFRFLVSIILIAVLVTLLYLPFPQQTQGPINQMGRIARPIGTYMKIYPDIVRKTFIWETQSWNSNRFFTILLLMFFAAGIIASVKDFPNQLILISLFLTLPFILFLAAKPDDSLIRNAPDRYFIFLLPFFFFLIARGISAFWQTTANGLRSLLKEFPNFKTSWFVSAGLGATFLIFCAFLFPQISQHYLYRKNLPDFKGALSYINDHVESDAIIFFEGSFNLYFEESNIWDGFPIYVKNYYQSDIEPLTKLDLSSKLEKLVHQKRQFWGVVYTPGRVDVAKDAAESMKFFQKISVVQFERDRVGTNLTKFLKILSDLRPSNREDYSLIATQIYLREKDIDAAKEEIQNLKNTPIFNWEGELVRLPEWNSMILSRRAVFYRRISRTLYDIGELEELMFTFHRYAGYMISTNKISSSINYLESLLTRRMSTEYRYRLVTEYLNLIPIQEGLFFIWKDVDGWHIRWKGYNSQIEGNIKAPAIVRGIKKYRFGQEVRYGHSSRSIQFSVNASERKISGLDFRVKNRAGLTFTFSIDGQRAGIKFLKNKKRVLKNIPSPWKYYRGKNFRTFVFIR